MKVYYLGVQPYTIIHQKMMAFTETRTSKTEDELWLLEHKPSYTTGVRNRYAHESSIMDIPVIVTDRGGLTTYHGPGQITGYTLVDLKRLKWTIRQLVNAIELSLQQVLGDLEIQAMPRPDAPGLYTTEGKKIASLGLKIRQGRSYHGFTLNVDMDMQPWQHINACGLGVKMTQIADLKTCCPPIQTLMQSCARYFQQKIV